MIKDFTLGTVKYNHVFKIRKQLETFMLGRSHSRIKYIADIVERLNNDGHYCRYGTISGHEMRQLKRRVLLNEHRLKYKQADYKPDFEEKTIDYSMIIDEAKYVTWIFFASNVAMAQASIMSEPNSEADFCFGHSIYQGVIGLELTCDANHKVIPRAFMWSANDESTAVWSIFLEHITVAFPMHDNSNVVLKVDGAKGAWAAILNKTKRLGFRDHRHRADNAQLKFGVKGKAAYHRIAKARDVQQRNHLISQQSEKFKK